MTTGLDREANRQAVRRAVGEATAGGTGVDLVVLPEATMATFGDQVTDLVPLAEPLDGPFVGTLAQLAAGTGATIVAGMFEIATPTEAAAGKVRNSVVAVGPDGLIGAYRKLHLYDALGWRESDRISPGDPVADQVLVFPVDDLVVGVMNCYDLRFPEMARRLVDAGATVLVEPAHWINGPGKADTWTTLLRARAIESTAYVVAAAKPEPECAGHSMVVDPMGQVLAAMDGVGAGQIVADLSAERIAEVRQVLPVLANRRFSVVPRPGPVAPGQGPWRRPS
jgi:predicted amidohydrolase